MEYYLIQTWDFMARTEFILAVVIAGIALACVLLLTVSVARRLRNARKYRILDRLRNQNLPLLKQMVVSGRFADEDLRKFITRPNSLEWTAIEDNLFNLLDEGMGDAVTIVFEKLGYTDYYRKLLDSPKVMTQTAAITKIGTLKDRESAEKLLLLMGKNNGEINAAAARAFCKIGDMNLFPRFLTNLSDMLDKKSISTKTIDSSLALIELELLQVLLGFAHTCKDSRVVTSILKVLGNIPADISFYEFAVMSLDQADPEIRAKASKIIANFEIMRGLCNLDAWPRLLKDPVWFVRLQAVRVMGKQQCGELVEHVTALVCDEKWQVRNAAAEALVNLNEGAIEIFLGILRSSDRYAKESICEVMLKTGFVEKLFALLEEESGKHVSNIYEMLSFMTLLGFTSQLKSFLDRSESHRHVAALEKILSEKVA